ncbi:hypothetical protein L873DRAFT_1839987 [Choiromyces venosus 120613-1]|uniref:Uncharacterized protein n=1 Tax=Choiromyces venosus 120613-1 TaxID=1336337 RepID=A0A3N4K807_9PEZI|nr:hypothetical protein L873DRAFT_1839987 [Choiromyces venosus 120613-1]
MIIVFNLKLLHSKEEEKKFMDLNLVKDDKDIVTKSTNICNENLDIELVENFELVQYLALVKEDEMGLCWKDNGWDSQIVNTKEVKRGRQVKEDSKGDYQELYGDRQMEDEIKGPAVPEEYDQLRQRNWAITEAIDGEVEEAEREAFWGVSEFLTVWQPDSYQDKVLNSSATMIPTCNLATKEEGGVVMVDILGYE